MSRHDNERNSEMAGLVHDLMEALAEEEPEWMKALSHKPFAHMDDARKEAQRCAAAIRQAKDKDL